jgi:hypothetical protein
MDVALQRRRLYIALGVTAAALIVASIAIAASFAFRAAWGIWLFVAAIVAGFGSHAWLILGVARDRKPT